MLAGKIVKFNLPNVFLNPRNQIRKKLSPADHRFAMSSSYVYCNQSPDAWTLGLWDWLRPDDNEAFCCSLLASKSTCEFQVEPGKCNRSPDAWPGFSSPMSSVCGTLHDPSPDDLGTWSLQSVLRRLRRVIGYTRFYCNGHNWHMVHRLAPYHCSVFNQRWTLFHFLFKRARPCLRMINPEIALVNLPTASL